MRAYIGNFSGSFELAVKECGDSFEAPDEKAQVVLFVGRPFMDDKNCVKVIWHHYIFTQFQLGIFLRQGCKLISHIFSKLVQYTLLPYNRSKNATIVFNLHGYEIMTFAIVDILISQVFVNMRGHHFEARDFSPE